MNTDSKAIVTASDTVGADNSKAKSSKRVVTLAQLGPTLPIGFHVSSGSPVREFSMRPWRTREERAMAKFKKPGMNPAQHLSMVLSCMLTRFYTAEWADIPEREKDINTRRVQIGQAFAGDALYAYCYLRREALGNTIPFNVKCPSCDNKWTFTADLDTLEVTVVDDLDSLSWEYNLVTPVTIRGKMVTKFRMTAPRWGAMEQSVVTGQEATAKIAVVKSAIVGFNDDTTALAVTDNDIDDITKRDLEQLVLGIDNHHIGPNMSLEGECGKCNRVFRMPLDWRYDNFFSASSQ